MHECPRDHDAALLARRHLSYELLREVRGGHALESVMSLLAHLRRDVKVWPQRRRGEESGDHGVDAAGDSGALAREVGLDHAEMAAQLRDVPALAGEEADA